MLRRSSLFVLLSAVFIAGCGPSSRDYEKSQKHVRELEAEVAYLQRRVAKLETDLEEANNGPARLLAQGKAAKNDRDIINALKTLVQRHPLSDEAKQAEPLLRAAESRLEATELAARKAAQLLDWPKARPILMSAGYYEEWTTAAVLWPDLIMAAPHVVEGIRESLRASPGAQAVMPPDFERIEFAAQLEALRSCIDPLEWFPSIWPTKIRVFEAWLSVQRVIAPGAPPSGLRKENASRLHLAVNLLANGKSKAEIADDLGISRSHLSQLFRRGARSRGDPK